MGSGGDLTAEDYRNLAEFRRQIRQFLSFSEGVARRHGIEPKQHQFLLTLKGLPENVRPAIGEIASRLFIQHHSAVELVNRLVKAGFVVRSQGEWDRREVWVRMTAAGATLLRRLSLAHQDELKRSGPALTRALQSVIRSAQYRSRSLAQKSRR
jgi:DNA-binding MarR family transcriptional regulator